MSHHQLPTPYKRPLDGGKFGDGNIDQRNEDTFGSGAVEEDWELDHNNFVEFDISRYKKQLDGKEESTENLGLDIPKVIANGCHQENFQSPLLSPSQLNEEELELSNQQLAAAVEELVLNSDQDQDAIDPAIVSLRRQATPSAGKLPASPKLPPHYDTSKSNQFGQSKFQEMFRRPQGSMFTGKMSKIWKEKETLGLNFLSRLGGSAPTPPPGFEPRPSSPPLEDEAILTAIKDRPMSCNPLLSLSNPLVVKAEDLERELQGSSSRGPSPIYGISIPEENPPSPVDRSLPARSVSPIFGSPSPSNLPIGTPPKHVIMDMMHQLEQQKKAAEQDKSGVFQHPGTSGTVPHPYFSLPPGVPAPPLPIIIHTPNRPIAPNSSSRMQFPVQAAPANFVWPARPGVPINPLNAQDFQRLGFGMPPRSPVQSPIGSPHTFDASHSAGKQNIRRNMPMPPGVIANQGFPLCKQSMMPSVSAKRLPLPRFGPGHLHPEHSKFVRMRQQRHDGRRDRRHYNNHRGQNREGVVGIPGDPYANIMTQKEKDWVIRIQMMALQSDRPEIDDYYYQNYIEQRLRDGKLNSNDSNTPTRLITPTKPNMENRKYVPVQFVNSLGKLTASSVYNPRQIIDLAQPAPAEEDGGNIEQGTNSRLALSKRLVVYKIIEKAYDLIVVMEELQYKLENFNEVPIQERDLLRNDLQSKSESMVDVLGFHDNTEFHAHADPVFQVMKIRKGKKLVARAIPFLCQEYGFIVAQSIFAHLAILIKRDSKDRVLHEMYPPLSNVISLFTAKQFVNACSFLTSFALTAAIKDQVGATIICKLLNKGSELFSSVDDITEKSQWKKFVSDVHDVIISVANPKEGSRHSRPSNPSPLLEGFPNVFQVLDDTNKNVSSEKLKRSYQQLITEKSNADGVKMISD
ncbi:unnamed protein product [Clavelina lepadiformis]|uniref:mRNA decay factor PAT1 domain-containing protein n=1 Tax=Clavelina lepadiformis TaxID=159417 RepID=A0ABP0GPS5_CLALP